MKLSEIQIREFYEDGYTIVKQAYSLNEINELKQIYKNLWLEEILNKNIIQEENNPLLSLFPRQRDDHLRNKKIFSFIAKTSVISILESLIKEEVDIVSTNYYFKAPGDPGMPMHQDNYGIGVSPGNCYAIWTSLDDTSENNGSMRFVQGTGNSEILEPKKIYDENADTFAGYTQTLEVSDVNKIITLNTHPGDIVIYNGNVIHDSLPNNSNTSFRNSIITHYAPISTKKITLNYNKILNKNGDVIRKRPNLRGLKK